MFFSGFFILFTFILLLILGIFLFIVIRSVFLWNTKNHSPRRTVTATVVAKRMDVFYRITESGKISSSSYYTTFQVESGDQIELPMSDEEYALLANGDYGNLCFQDMHYLGFERFF